MERLVRLASGSSDLTLAHWLVLVHLSKTSSCKQADLKSATGFAPAHLTKLLDELVDRRLVHRHRSSWDRRQILLASTGTGRETARKLLLSLSQLAGKARVEAIESLSSSLEGFVSMTANDGWLDGTGTESKVPDDHPTV
ncbi:MarR family winged helix-turn-helix transcriptional regulator [Dyella choica]|nr:MarR family transcriptional regulator [Dyella choica]